MRQTPFCSATPYSPILVRQRLNCRGTESYRGRHGYTKIPDYMSYTLLQDSMQLKGQNTKYNENQKPNKNPT